MEDPGLILRRLERERKARVEAEAILESKSRQLFYANQELKRLNQSLEKQVAERTFELSKTQKQFRSLVESAGDIIFNADPKGVFTYVNPAAIRLLGFSEQELLGQKYLDLVKLSDRKRVQAFYVNMIEQQETSSYLEFPAVLKNGGIKWLGQRLQISYSNGKPEGITAVARDIQGLHDARRAIENSEKKYRGIIEGMELGLMEVNRNGTVVFVNHWFCEMTGFEAAEIIGRDPNTLFLTEEGRQLMQDQNRNRLKGRSGVYEIQLKRKSGEFIWTAISGAPIFNREEEMVGTVGLHLDITPQKQLQDKLEGAILETEDARMAEKEFLAHMSHEIRTPLNALMGMANLLSFTKLSGEQTEYVNDMLQASDLLHGLISDVLDISKIEAGEVELNRSPVDLRATLSMVIKTMEYRARDNGNTLKMLASEDLPLMIIADRIIINQVLMNLLDNANKFTKDGSITLRVEADKQNGTNPMLIHFEVKDTGVGIEPGKLSTVFERFQQVKTSDRTHDQRSTGLGLSISRSLVELHGGSINVFSVPGEGSSFSFSLLVEPFLSETIAITGQTVHGGGTSVKNYRILIAEDSYLTRKYLKGLFKKWDVDHILVEDGQEALEASQREGFDLILLDMQMPRLDGYETAQKIRTDRNNPNQSKPILALTASALVDERQKALDSGMNDHLTKPFTPFQLRDFIERNMTGQSIEVDDQAREFTFSSLTLPNLLEEAQLDRMYEGDLEHATGMFGIFCNMIDEEIRQSEASLIKNDRTEVTTWLHKMAPTMAMVGLSDIQKTFTDLENRLKEGEEWEVLKRELQTQLGSLKEALPSILTLKNTLEAMML